jgi:hypothetical protein
MTMSSTTKTTTRNDRERDVEWSSTTIFPTSRRRLTRKGRSATRRCPLVHAGNSRTPAKSRHSPPPSTFRIELPDLLRLPVSSARRMVSLAALLLFHGNRFRTTPDEKSSLTLCSPVSYQDIYRHNDTTYVRLRIYFETFASDGCRYYYRLYT